MSESIMPLAAERTNRPAAASVAGPLLDIEGLRVEFGRGDEGVVANRDVSLSVAPGEVLGLVGESGSGKSVLCRAVLRLLPSPPAAIRAGRILFEGTDLLTLPERRMRAIRGRRIAMVFQNPMTSLNPVWTIGDQITEGLRLHDGVSGQAARERGIELLRQVGIPDPERRYDEHPHQWSGGMLQRAVIAMAMACQPQLLLADEPTTALDVTIQDQILALLLDLQRRHGMAMVLVSHDMAVIAETSDRVAVMYAGSIVEIAPTAELFTNPQHPYTVGLLESIPHMDTAGRSAIGPIPGQPPDLARLGPGCPFAPRCPIARDPCRTPEATPRLRPVSSPRHATACLYPERIEVSN